MHGFFIIIFLYKLIIMSLQNKFDEAVKHINMSSGSKKQLNNDEKLCFYKYYKQALYGDNTDPKPGVFDFVGLAKWNAWNTIRGMTKETAQQNYVDLYDKFKH